MPYLIDGHNLIGQLPDIDLRDPHDEAKLVQKLRGFAARTGKKCVVVFDHGITGGRSKLSNSTVTVVFTARPGEADDYILRRVRETNDTYRWTVVSSDRRVLETARKRGMRTLKSIEFADKLNPALPAKTGEEVDIYVPPSEVKQWLTVFEAHGQKLSELEQARREKKKRKKRNRRR